MNRKNSAAKPENSAVENIETNEAMMYHGKAFTQTEDRATLGSDLSAV